LKKIKYYYIKNEINLGSYMEYQNIFSDSASKMKASKIRELMKYASMPGVISFGGGSPDPLNFPFAEVKDIINKWDDKKAGAAMQYGGTEGYPPLIEKIAERMKDKKNIDLTGQKIQITTGGQQGVFLLSKILLNPDDIVLVEEPSFIGAMASFLSHQARLVGVPLKNDGVDCEALEQTVIDLAKSNKKPKFFYTIPNFQNPGGSTLSMGKRKKIYEISKKYDLIVLEDDPYGDLYFNGEEKDYLPIKSLGADAPIVYMGSFSKILCPGFRLGWLLGDGTLIDKAALAKQSVDACSTSFGQFVAYDYLASGAIDGYLSKMRSVYRTKKDFMIEAIRKYFPKEARYTEPNGGFFIYVDLPEGVSGEALFKKTMEKKIAFVTGEAFHIDPVEGDKHIRLSFSNSSKEEIEKGIAVIAEEMNNVLK